MSAGSARLTFTQKMLREHRDIAKQQWSDQVSPGFREEPPDPARPSDILGDSCDGEARRGPRIRSARIVRDSFLSRRVSDDPLNPSLSVPDPRRSNHRFVHHASTRPWSTEKSQRCGLWSGSRPNVPERDGDGAGVSRTRSRPKSTRFQEALGKVTKAATSEIEATEIRYKSVATTSRPAFEAERREVDTEFASVRNKTATWYRSATKSAKREHEETRLAGACGV